ncbi:hypothetical protein [Nonomuraea sp. NPDC003804]|uniref:hypothetical protein n=1 Tax=Nonomuraea sp. NPDC003804 TaxID=3154547 RepID=UPI0033B89969
MEHRVVSLRLPVLAQDVLLALFITVMQVQGTIVRNAGEVIQRRSPTSENWDMSC